MKETLKATIEIVKFHCNDIITTSEHDNGFIDGGNLAYLINEFKNAMQDIF